MRMLEFPEIDRTYTLEEYLQLPEGPPYYELDDGVLVLVTDANMPHGQWIGRLFGYLDAWSRQHGGLAGLEAGAPLSSTRRYIPDLSYVAHEHMDRVAGGRIQGMPDLAVEVFNHEGARRDRVHKFNVYRDHGLEWYWLADYEGQVLEEYHLEDGAYVRTAAAGAGDEFRPQALPGLVIPVDDIAR